MGPSCDEREGRAIVPRQRLPHNRLEGGYCEKVFYRHSCGGSGAIGRLGGSVVVYLGSPCGRDWKPVTERQR